MRKKGPVGTGWVGGSLRHIYAVWSQLYNFNAEPGLGNETDVKTHTFRLGPKVGE